MGVPNLHSKRNVCRCFTLQSSWLVPTYHKLEDVNTLLLDMVVVIRRSSFTGPMINYTPLTNYGHNFWILMQRARCSFPCDSLFADGYKWTNRSCQMQMPSYCINLLLLSHVIKYFLIIVCSWAVKPFKVDTWRTSLKPSFPICSWRYIKSSRD